MPTLLSLGHGYCASAFARLLLARGWRVVGTARSPERLGEIAATGVEARAWPGPGSDSGLRDAFDAATHLLTSVAPDAAGDPVLRLLGEEVARAAPRLLWAGYLSTTGVYGDRGGGWVDEGSELRPATERGRWRVAAEAAWRAVPRLPLHVFRLAGIYGPGRGPFAKVRGGTARRVVKDGQWFSRIHVEDVARVLLASTLRPNPGAVYNLCDDDPAPPQDVIAHAAELLGLPPPPLVPFAEAEMTPMARSFYAESKRVRNGRIKEELGVRLLHPDYRAGLAALLAEDGGAGPGEA